ncbi:signal peptidase II [Micrococcus sp.]|uniref:signal peptidase II n=1 Tax=Micrococcus sp. TaxID=1271 RepID=UPI002A90D2A9|nr:signal peptidase II [Micrococcus sp.]MDY6055553.1 signal peptidase II [Micrococcus sp.]
MSRPQRAAGVRGLQAAALGIAVLAYGADQLTKALVERTMQLGQTIPVIPGLLNWHYLLNPGAAFSIGTGATWVFTLIQAAVAAVVVVLLVTRVRSLPWALCLGALLGGVLGNLTDRLFRPPAFGRGHVVDMISVPHFAVFNVADSFIVCAMAVVCVLVLTGRRLDGTREG